MQHVARSMHVALHAACNILCTSISPHKKYSFVCVCMCGCVPCQDGLMLYCLINCWWHSSTNELWLCNASCYMAAAIYVTIPCFLFTGVIGSLTGTNQSHWKYRKLYSIYGFVGPQRLLIVNQIVPLVEKFSDLTSVSDARTHACTYARMHTHTHIL